MVKEEVMGFYIDFYEIGIFMKELNSIFLVLISKKGWVGKVKNFKSISLVGSI